MIMDEHLKNIFKARGHSKQVETFRYYDNVIPVLEGILESEVNI